MSIRTPKYRLHKGSGQALVEINGKRTYLGKYGTPQSREKYGRLIAEWLAAGNQAAAPAAANGKPDDSIVISELILAFWKHAEQRYRKDGEPTSEIRSFRVALRPVATLYGRQAVTDFGPLALVACRQQLIDAGICRKRINQHVSRIRKVFKWGVAREMVPQSVWYALSAVEGLRRGEAAETEPIRPANEEHVTALEPFVTPQIWAMVQFQLWTACRPGEVCRLRTIDLKMDEADWEYRPHTHKVEHHGKERIVFIGPHAQKVITPWLKTDLHAYLFSPKEARAWFDKERRRKRKTPMTPSQRARKRKVNPKRVPGDFYSTIAYDHAIQRACDQAAVPKWAPNQLRHTAATKIRKAYGIEAARIILGHSSAATSEIYAEIDQEKAKEIMRKLG